MPTFPNSDGKDFAQFLKKKEGKICTLEIKETQDRKSLNSHKYFIGVICPCVAHAEFEIGNISKSTFLSLSSDDCINITKDLFFVKDKIDHRLKKYYSLKVKDWGESDWALKMQSIIDILIMDYGYNNIPQADTKHARHFLRRLKDQVSKI